MVANHNCFRLRGALREVAKVHGRPAGEIREVTRRIPWYHEGEPLDSLLATHPNFQGLDLPRGVAGLCRARPSRWSACRGISRSTPAAWSSCRRRSPTTCRWSAR